MDRNKGEVALQAAPAVGVVFAGSLGTLGVAGLKHFGPTQSERQAAMQKVGEVATKVKEGASNVGQKVVTGAQTFKEGFQTKTSQENEKILIYQIQIRLVEQLLSKKVQLHSMK